ncbi:hypothetical protein [Myxococcus sp. RHSTA-1-4]|uniref:hypothetical protein n=1 Tax=Myxococcus sp. RHSTA-1-4 TaxID=2874601 RepID=UPI001CBE5673|nr:hypothetical protein [Myxococcus sp. RHSTA-1-4]MBZ4422010.1 hypothetical protein [Myxococcus sp. RHSTA-1-4]
MLAAAACMLAARACSRVIRRDLYEGSPLLACSFRGEDLAAIRTWMERVAAALDAVAVGAAPRLLPGALLERLRALQDAAKRGVPHA